MPKNTHLEAVSADAERLPEPAQRARDPQVIHDKAAALARSLTWLPNAPSSRTFAERSHVLAHDLLAWNDPRRNRRPPTISTGFTTIAAFCIRNSRMRWERSSPKPKLHTCGPRLA